MDDEEITSALRLQTVWGAANTSCATLEAIYLAHTRNRSSALLPPTSSDQLTSYSAEAFFMKRTTAKMRPPRNIVISGMNSTMAVATRALLEKDIAKPETNCEAN